jgi:carboxyl-terminal processing protease
MSPTTLEDFNISMRLHLDGIGARLKSEDGYTIVAEVLPGGAADQDGRLKVEDKIIGVADAGEKITDVVDMKLSDVVKRIRGRRGTTVVLRVLPAGQTDPIEYPLVRAKIELNNSEARGEVIEVGNEDGHRPQRVGYIDLPSFYMDVAEANRGNDNYKSCTRDVRALLEKFQKTGPIDAVILDLRNNGGGALNEAISLTGLFIDRGSVVQVKGPRGKVEPYDDEEQGTAYSGPLVVLVSKLSASASEILAGAIQDYSRGLIVGDSSTHGKGTVQTVVPVARNLGGNGGADLGALKVTIQKFYRVNGDSTQNHGVASDVVLPSKWDHLEIGESHLPQALPFDRVDPVKHANLALVSADLKRVLTSLSEKRQESSPDFQKLADYFDRLETFQKRKAIPLNEKQLREERRRADADNDDDGDIDLDKPRKKDAPVFERTFYNNEVLAITQDFLRVGGHPRVSSNL